MTLFKFTYYIASLSNFSKYCPHLYRMFQCLQGKEMRDVITTQEQLSACYVITSNITLYVFIAFIQSDLSKSS